MRKGESETLVEALATLRIVSELFEGSLLAVCLHRSAALGELQPQSDVVLLVVIDQPMTNKMRESLLAA